MDELSMSPTENSTDSKDHPLVIPQITFNVADEDEEYLHEDELDGGVWKGPPGSLSHDIDDEFDPELLEHLQLLLLPGLGVLHQVPEVSDIMAYSGEW